MTSTLENLFSTFSNTIISPGLGGAELLVTGLMACGFLLIGISSLLPKNKASGLEWWER